MSSFNGYSLTERWFSFMAENGQKVECKHTAVYLYIVEQFNKRQWVNSIGLPTDFTMSALNIGSYKTYKKILTDLVEFGFLKIEWSKNQHTSNKIGLVKNTKASSKHIPKQCESNDQSTFSINKTYKQLNNKHINTILDYFDSLPSDVLQEKIKELKPIQESDKIDFNVFWDLYAKKKGNKEKIKSKWDNLSLKTQERIIETLPKFIYSISDKQYQPNPETYLNNKRWEDEIEDAPVESTGYKPQYDWKSYLKTLDQ